ncbi:hypothetical protein AAG906_021575 [Vitis piasezkii]
MFFFLAHQYCIEGIKLLILVSSYALFLRAACSHYCRCNDYSVKEQVKKIAFLSRMIEWDSHNHMILTWIRNTSIPSISNLLGSFDDAKSAWDMLTKRYSTTHGSMKYQLVVELHQLRQEPGQSINDYYDQLRFIWDQIDLSDPTWACSKDAQQYASIRDEFRLYEFLMSLHKDFEPIRGQLLNRSPAPSLDTAVNELQLGDFSGSSNRRKQTNKKFCNYCSGHTIETCYRCNKSLLLLHRTYSANGFHEIIAQAVRMAGNASLSTALSVLPGKSQTWLFDSACCNHMTPHSSLFSNLDPAPHPLNIHIADGSTMHGNSLGFVSTSNLSVPRVFHDPRTGQELGTGPRVGRMFPVNNLHLPPVAPVSLLLQLSLHSYGTIHHLTCPVPLKEMVELKENFVIFLTIVLYFFLLVFMLFMQLTTFQVLSFIIETQMSPRSRLCCFLGFAKLKRGIGVMILSLIVFAFLVMLSFGNTDCLSSTKHSTSPLNPVRSIPPHLLDYHCYTPLLHFTSLKPIVRPLDPLWQIAMQEELDALTKNHTWDLVTLPPGDSLWLVVSGSIRSRLALMDPDFAPVARISSVRALLVVAAARKWDLFQMDVKNAFLNGDLSEEVYMQPPPGLSVESNKVCHLRRALYGLKQAPRAWFAKFSSTIFRLGYTASPYDSALFLRRTDKGTILLLLYVDDMIITGDDLSGIQELKDFLSQQFEMKDLGHLSYFLGLEITHSTDGLYITQAKYASDLLSQAGLTDSKTVDTPIELNAHLTPSGGKPLSNPSLYRRLVGSLVYLTVTRPDISYVVHQVSQYLSAPRSTHYAVVLRILRYLKGTLFHGLFYSAQSPLVLRAFSDADWAGDPTDRRSTTGYCFLLGSSLISWRSKKQTFVARSSTEAEYRALADTTSELLWLRWLLKDLGVSTSSATPLYCDNQSAIHIAHNDVFHERTKHIEIDCHFIRYHLVHGALKLFSVSSKDQLADIFTKSLPKRRTRTDVYSLIKK